MYVKDRTKTGKVICDGTEYYMKLETNKEVDLLEYCKPCERV